MNTRYFGGAIVAIMVAVGVSACNQASSASADAQGGSLPAAAAGPAVPYKLGTFERDGKPFMALVLHDTQAVDIAQANSAFERGNGSAARLAVPADLKELIANYEAGWRDRLGEIARA